MGVAVPLLRFAGKSVVPHSPHVKKLVAPLHHQSPCPFHFHTSHFLLRPMDPGSFCQIQDRLTWLMLLQGLPAESVFITDDGEVQVVVSSAMSSAACGAGRLEEGIPYFLMGEERSAGEGVPGA